MVVYTSWMERRRPSWFGFHSIETKQFRPIFQLKTSSQWPPLYDKNNQINSASQFVPFRLDSSRTIVPLKQRRRCPKSLGWVLGHTPGEPADIAVDPQSQSQCFHVKSDGLDRIDCRAQQQQTLMAPQQWMYILLVYTVALQQVQSIGRSTFSSSRQRRAFSVGSQWTQRPPSERIQSVSTEALQPILSPVILQIRGGASGGLLQSLLDKTKGMGILHNILRSICQNLFDVDVSSSLEKEVKQKSKKSKSKNRSPGKATEETTTPNTGKQRSKKTTSIKSKTSKVATTETAKKSTKKAGPKASKLTNQHLKTTLKSTNPNYRIQQELKSFLKDPPEHLRIKVGKNIRVWIVEMQGVGIYEGELFKLRISFPPNYPTVPPSVYFTGDAIPTHEHVYTNGDICLSLLGKDWRPTMTAQSIAHSILSILGSAHHKSLPMDNAKHAQNKPGQYQQDWVYHDDCKLPV